MPTDGTRLPVEEAATSVHRRFLLSSQSSKALDRTWTLRRFRPGALAVNDAMGHSRRSDGQQGLAECPLCLHGDRMCASQRADAMYHERSLHSITLSARSTRLAGTSCLIVCAAEIDD